MPYSKNRKLIFFGDELLGQLQRRAQRQSEITGERVSLSATVRQACRLALAVWMREEVSTTESDIVEPQ